MSATWTGARVGVAVAAVVALAGGAAAQPAAELGPQAALTAMGIVGYADRLSVAPGETIRFMVSSELPTYRAEIVRLIHGDANPNGPGIKEERVATAADGDYPGRHQDLPLGSYVTVPDAAPLRLGGSFTITAWVAPTRPGVVGWTGEPGAQGVVTKWADDRGYGLMIDEQGRLALWLGAADGQLARVAAEPALRRWVPAIPGAGRPRPHGVPTQWYFVAASFDADTGRVTLYQEPLDRYANDPTRVVVEETTPLGTLATPDEPLRIAAYGTADSGVAGHYNGKIDNPRIYGRALSRSEVEAIAAGDVAAGAGPVDAVASWDFAADIETDRVRDTAGRGLDGRTVNQPTRAVTGHRWDATEMDYRRAREQYGAIHFHDDDLLDAGWDVGFALEVPADLRSGVYAARLRTTTSEDYVPFFVRPPHGTATAKIAFLVPTVSYLAYAGTGGTGFQPMSLYSTHTDGSGVTYSSRLRPITNMRPKIDTRNPWQFMADTHLVDWLEVKGFTVDVVTDGDLHTEGAALLEPYNVVLTGTHPEYYSWEMLQGLRSYLEQGGRLMYMGGNGFYWVTPVDPTGDVHRGAAARRHRALAGGPGGGPPQPDRRAGRVVALPRPGPAVAGGRGVHGAGVRPQLAVPADAEQLRPARRLHLRGHRRQRADRQPPVAGAGLRSGGVGARPRGLRAGVAAAHPGAGPVVRPLRRVSARHRGSEHQQLGAGRHGQPAGLRGPGVRRVPERGRGLLHELDCLER